MNPHAAPALLCDLALLTLQPEDSPIVPPMEGILDLALPAALLLDLHLAGVLALADTLHVDHDVELHDPVLAPVAHEIRDAPPSNARTWLTVMSARAEAHYARALHTLVERGVVRVRRTLPRFERHYAVPDPSPRVALYQTVRAVAGQRAPDATNHQIALTHLATFAGYTEQLLGKDAWMRLEPVLLETARSNPVLDAAFDCAVASGDAGAHAETTEHADDEINLDADPAPVQ